MRERLFIIGGFILLAILIVGLNAASYTTQKNKMPDREVSPNRSTYNTGATGTRAFYELLAETGRTPVRWQEKPSQLTKSQTKFADTFVIIGATRREITEEETTKILEWVTDGGKLVLIDREPHPLLLSTSAYWHIQNKPGEDVVTLIDPLNQKLMTEGMAAVKPLLPTVYTRNVNAVQPSRFASSAEPEFAGDGNNEVVTSGTPTTGKEVEYLEEDEPPPPPPKKIEESSGRGSGIGNSPPKEIQTEEKFKIGEESVKEAEAVDEPNLTLNAPVVHFAGAGKNILIEMPYGAGEIVYLSDPYIVSNAGISLVDNAQMAVNVVASRGGMIAFDEYHQGYGAGENRLLNYFAETPVIPIFLQILLLVGVVMFTQSRRFARPLPAREPNRLSKLEYVSAMAELQNRTKAYDLALENIYSDFRRRVAKFVGADNFQTTHTELSALLAEKSGMDKSRLEALMFKCEEIIHGEPSNRKELLELTKQLREIEEKIGLKRRRAMRKGV